MIIEFHKWHGDYAGLRVQREPGDPRAVASGYTRSQHGWGAEIHLLHMVLKRLQAAGFVLTSVKISSDGHLMGDEHMRYLRPPSRLLRCKKISVPIIYVYDGKYMLRSSAEEYNSGEPVTFDVVGNIMPEQHPQPDWWRKIKLLSKSQTAKDSPWKVVDNYAKSRKSSKRINSTVE